jgi:hypothetical protein
MRTAVFLTALAVTQLSPLHAGMIGFRQDGTGIAPPDCRPGTHLLWQVPLPNFGNGSPIVVEQKVFVVCEAGWPEGAVLLCHDAVTGKELWRRELDEFAMMPAEQAKEARPLRTEYYRRIRRLNQIMWEYQAADETKRAALLKEAGELAAVKSFDRYNWGTGSAEQAVSQQKEFGAKLKKVCAYAPITWSPTTIGVNMTPLVSDGKRVFVFTGRRNVFAFDLDGKLLWQVWQSDAPYNYHWPEDCANAPLIVDGKLIMYVFDHCWAYDLDTGKLLWKVQSGVIRHGMGTPVVLRLPVPGAAGKTETMVFLWTGDLIRVRDGKRLLQDVTKVMFGGMTSDGDQMVYAMTYGKDAVEAKSLKPGQLKFELPAKTGSTALRFALTDPDTATVDQVWNVAERLGSYPILHQGKLYTTVGAVLEAATGKALSAGEKSKEIGENGFILAGNQFFGLPVSAVEWPRANSNNPPTTAVLNVKPLAGSPLRSMPLAVFPAKITEPAMLAKVVAMTGFDYYKNCYGWHQSFSCPFAAGNKLYVRTFDHLYCFGDK